MLLFGFASVTVHINVAVSPSLTLYGFDVPELTSGLSNKTSDYFEMYRTHIETAMSNQESSTNLSIILDIAA